MTDTPMNGAAPPGSRPPIKHFVSTEPFDAMSVEALTPEQERFYMASQWQLMWWKLKRHHLAIFFGAVLLVMYGSTLISEILAPYDLHTKNAQYIYAPPQSVHLFNDGEFVGPFVYGYKVTRDIKRMKRIYTIDTTIYLADWRVV